MLLSAGQRQRIAIARTVLKNPSILILDEATSNIDTLSESLIQDALERVMGVRTTIIIGHRMNAVKRASKIVALRDGEVIETGTHNELVDQRGVYAQLFELGSTPPVD